MVKYRATITIVQEFESRSVANQRVDQITSKVPDSWTLQREDVARVE